MCRTSPIYSNIQPINRITSMRNQAPEIPITQQLAASLSSLLQASEGQPIQSHELCQYSLSLMWQDQQAEREKLTGSIQLVRDMSLDQTKAKIFEDLSQRKFNIKPESRLIIRISSTTQINFTHEKVHRRCSLGTHKIEGVLIESKFNLPQGYSYLPNRNLASQIKNLSVSNLHGTITWNSSVSIPNLDFESCIRISEQEIECHPKLGVQALVEFNSLPTNITGLDEGKLIRKMSKCVNKLSHSKMIKYNSHNGHWFVKLNCLKTTL